MDPNEVRLRQNPTQHTSSSSANTTNSPNVNASVNAPHGGDMDPNEVRLRQARIQQLSGTSSPAANIPEPNNNLGSHGGVWMHQTQIQPAQYGSSSHLINTPSSPQSGYNTYQTPQSPQSAHSGGYFTAQNQHQPSFPHQTQQLPYSQHSGSPAHGNVQYPMASSPPQSPPGAPYARAPSYGPSQTWPVGNLPPKKKKSLIRRVHDFLMKQGSNEKRR